MALKNAIFRYSANLSSGFESLNSEKLQSVLHGQMDDVTLPRLDQDSEEWRGSGKVKENVRTLLNVMQARYVLGGQSVSLETGVHNKNAEIVITLYLRPESGVGASVTEKHFMTGPLQDPELSQIRQGTINRSVYIQDCIVYRKQQTIDGKLVDVRLVDTTGDGKNLIRRGDSMVPVEG